MSLSAENVTCLRGDRLVFRDISFDLAGGQALWVRGRNGAGKSTLLRIAARLLRPQAGRFFWNRTDITEDDEPYHGQYHYIGHQEVLKPVLTVAENLSFWAEFHGQGKASLEQAIEGFELGALRDTPAGLLSAGQKKRTNLARLLASPAPLWILDEPLSALDTHFIDLFRARLSEHLKAGGLALYATHQDLGIDGSQELDLDAGGGA
ncbi:MAG: heme ABC exporter ATP-binding protein CcmA [Alphaproteobacteria bacterium]|nr:MAG: heme ABC exporter ATP-binding protein CcmA [Alphaproteobacteria bacterium]